MNTDKNSPITIEKLMEESKFGFSNLQTLIKILLCFAASAASAERSFSALNRIKKIDKRTTMTETRLSNLVLINVNRKRLPKEEKVIEMAFNKFGRMKIFI